jgi:flagellar hook assembly protein FlgD
MGTWDGKLENGADAPMGVYAFVIEYKQLASSSTEKIVGTITLIR